MLIPIPDNLNGKITYAYHDVVILPNVKLSDEEMEEFKKFREYVRYSFEHRFDD